eukprot:s1732_g1.t1
MADIPAHVSIHTSKAIIVLGFEIDWLTGDVPSGGLLEARLELAQRAAIRSPPRWLILSGGIAQKGPYVGVNSEAQAMQKWLNSKQLQLWDEVILEESSYSTRTNALHSMKLLQDQSELSPGAICVATNAFHRFRAWRIFLRVMQEAQVQAAGIYMLHEPTRTVPRRLERQPQAAVSNVTF